MTYDINKAIAKRTKANEQAKLRAWSNITNVRDYVTDWLADLIKSVEKLVAKRDKNRNNFLIDEDFEILDDLSWDAAWENIVNGKTIILHNWLTIRDKGVSVKLNYVNLSKEDSGLVIDLKPESILITFSDLTEMNISTADIMMKALY
jgi:hypothetical protein